MHISKAKISYPLPPLNNIRLSNSIPIYLLDLLFFYENKSKSNVVFSTDKEIYMG